MCKTCSSTGDSVSMGHSDYFDTSPTGLESLVDTKGYEILCCVTLAGIKLAPAVRLTDNIRLVPASDLPLQLEETPPVDAALITSIVVTSPLSKLELKELLAKTEEDLWHCAHVLSLADPDHFAPLPISWVMFAAEGSPSVDIRSKQYLDIDGPILVGIRCIWPPQCLEEVQKIADLFLSLSPDVRSRYEVGLQRFADAKRRGSQQHASLLNLALDLGIALDSLFLAEDTNSDINYRLQIRIAKLLSEDVDERVKISERVNNLYGLRSESAHGRRKRKSSKHLDC